MSSLISIYHSAPLQFRNSFFFKSDDIPKSDAVPSRVCYKNSLSMFMVSTYNILSSKYNGNSISVETFTNDFTNEVLHCNRI